MEENKYPANVDINLINLFQRQCNQEEFKVLEIGCNSGYNLKALYDIYPKAEYYGLDSNQTAIEQAQEFFPEATFFHCNMEENISISKRGVFKYLFKDNFLDYILLPNVLEHFYDPETVLNKIYTKLKPEGKLLLVIPNLMHISVIGDLLVNGNFTYTETGLLDFDHKKFFTYNEIKRILTKTNFKVEEISYFQNDLDQNLLDFIQQLVELSHNHISPFEYSAILYYVVASKTN